MEQQPSQLNISPEPQPNPQPEIPKKTHLPKWASILIIVIVAFVAIGLVGWNAYKLIYQTPPGLPENNEEIIFTKKFSEKKVGWRIYYDENFGIGFKYPFGWSIKSGVITSNNGEEIGSIEIITEEEFRKNFEDCLKWQTEDCSQYKIECSNEYIYGTCEYIYGGYGGDITGFKQQFDLVKDISDKPFLTKEEKEEIEENFSLIYYQGPGWAIDIDTIYNEHLDLNGLRIIGFSGLDASIGNYYYLSVFVAGDILITMRLSIFPYHSELYKWAEKKTGQNMEDFESFEKEFSQSLKSDQLNKLIKDLLNEYDLIVHSIFIL